MDNLLETLKNLCEIDDIQCNKLKSFDLANIKTLIKNVDKRTDFASAILEQSEKYTTVSFFILYFRTAFRSNNFFNEFTEIISMEIGYY